ncbi:MAG: tetratricopeptide repeat protein, partial [Chitinophagales bacterium]
MSRQSELKLANKQLKEGNELEEQGKYKEGLELFQQASTFYEKWEQWEEWVKVNINIGSIHSRRMQDKNGIAPLLQVLERGKKYLGKEHPLVGNCLREIGTYHAILGKYELALTYFLDALAIQRKKLGKRHSDVAKSLNGTGLCYYSTGNYDLAIYYIKDAFEIFKENFGKNHFQVANMLNNLGMCLFEKSNYPLAIEYHQKALAIKRKNWGEEHPSVALSLNNIGVCHLGRGDWDLAIQYHQEALAIRKKILGEESFDAAMSKNNLGVCYLDKKDYKLAIGFLQESLLVWRKILGEEHPKVAYSLLNLGLLYHFKGDNDLAIEYLQESLIIRKKSLGEVHPLVANVLEVIGLCYFAKEAYDLAISFSKEASAIFREKFGEKYARIAVNLHLLGNCYFAKEAYHLAIASYQNALIVFIPSFNQKNIFQNPILQGYNAGFLLLDTLYHKAKTLLQFYNQEPQSPKYLQAAFSTITLATDLVSEIRQSYKAEGSKHSLAENAAKVYHQAIDIALKTSRVYTELSQIPQHPEFTNIPYTAEGAENLAFDFAEQSKAVLLLSNFKDSEAKVNSNIPTVLLEKEQELKIELSYLEKNIVTQNSKGAAKDETLLTKFQRQYFNQKQEYDALIEKFEKDYPEYHQLKYSVSTASVQGLQNYLSKMSQKVSDTLFYDKKLGFDMLKSKIETLEVSDTSPS